MAEGARITIDAQLQFRHDVEANWLAADPILKVGEPAYTIGYSDRFKLGDGQSKWSELPYLQLGEGGGGGGSQAYESLAWSAIKTLTSGSASVLAQAYAVKQAYNELKSLIPNLADYYTKEQINALIPSLEGYAKESWVLGKGYATENFVNTKIADLINGAPTTLDTLKEIADAFAQSQDVIEALDEAIGKKANQSDLTALAARMATNEGNITGLSNNKLDKSIWDSVFEIDAKGNLRAKVGIYSTSFISARTSDPSAGGGGSGGEGGAFSLYTWDQVKAMTAEVGGVAPTAYALKQAYNELINATPTLSWNNIQDKPIFANVATSGSYSDLIGRPTALSDLANDVGYITAAALGGLASESWVSNNYLAKSGGTITGTLYFGKDLYQGASTQIFRNASSTVDYGTLIINAWNEGETSLNIDKSNLYFIDVNRTYNTLLHSGNYSSYALPLSGGTLTDLLFLKYANPKIVFQEADGTTKGTIGFYYGELSAYINNELFPIIHSGNIGSQSVNYATNAGGASYAERLSKTWLEDCNYSSGSNLKIISNPTDAAGNFVTGYQSGLSVMSDYVGWQLTSYGGSTQNPYFRSYQDNGTWKPWRQLAFLDDNVASATKLATSRTIWGQSFDGTADIPMDSVGTMRYLFFRNAANNNPAGYVGRGGSSDNIELIAYGAYNLDLGTNNSVVMRINSSGNVLIGTTEDSGYRFDSMGKGRFQSGEAGVLSIKRLAAGGALIDYYSMNQESNRWRVGSSDQYSFIWEYNGTDKMSLSNTGNLTASGNITVSGTIYSAVGMYTPGYLSARSTAGSSDRNLKTNVAPVRNALAYILGTKYVSFDWKDTGEHSVGIIAQDELNREWSCLVQKYSEHYSYQYTQHTALIGSALQEEDKKVEALKTEVATLKNKVQKLERQLWQQ